MMEVIVQVRHCSKIRHFLVHFSVYSLFTVVVLYSTFQHTLYLSTEIYYVQRPRTTSRKFVDDNTAGIYYPATPGDESVETKSARRTTDDDATNYANRIQHQLPSTIPQAYDPEEEVYGNTEEINRSSNIETIAYAVTLTECRKGSYGTPFPVIDAAAVLQHSIQHNSIRNTKSSSRYNYTLYAIYHPQATECALKLKQFGYTLLERTFPVPISEIQGEYLRKEIGSSGCCGERELVKLEIFTLLEHPLVVMLDLDVVVLKPLDPLFDLMLHNIYPEPINDHLMMIPPTVTIMSNDNTDNDTIFYNYPKQIDLVYTTDYGVSSVSWETKPVQGGFVIVRPNQTVYNDYIDIVKEGDYRRHTGWGGKSQEFWGALTFQGLIPYYFQNLHPGRSMEVNWCLYNNACSPARYDTNERDDDGYAVYNGTCISNQTDCEDCRERPPEEIYTFHYTVCHKPWTCYNHRYGPGYEEYEYDNRLCRIMHHIWFNIRANMEQTWNRSGWNHGTYDYEHYYGSCTSSGSEGYIPIQEPYYEQV